MITSLNTQSYEVVRTRKSITQNQKLRMTASIQPRQPVVIARASSGSLSFSSGASVRRAQLSSSTWTKDQSLSMAGSAPRIMSQRRSLPRHITMASQGNTNFDPSGDRGESKRRMYFQSIQDSIVNQSKPQQDYPK